MNDVHADVDAVTASVIRSAMETICFEMATYVSRTATTPILNQSTERNATILDATGHLAALSVGIRTELLQPGLGVQPVFFFFGVGLLKVGGDGFSAHLELSGIVLVDGGIAQLCAFKIDDGARYFELGARAQTAKLAGLPEVAVYGITALKDHVARGPELAEGARQFLLTGDGNLVCVDAGQQGAGGE